MRMMQDPVKDRVGHNGVLKYLVPFAKADIGCQYRAFLFVSFVDQLKEQFRLFFCDRQIPDLVDDQQLVPAVVLQTVFQPIFFVGFSQLLDEVVAFDEVGAVPLLGGFDSQAHGHMGFSYAAVSQKHDVLFVFQKPQG